jgi:thioester reductase-like protein
MRILLTGGSGLLGSSLLVRLLNNPKVEQIFLLLRENLDINADSRARELILKLVPPESHSRARHLIKPISGDLLKPYLGLSLRDRWLILEKVDQILHVGASTDFAAPIQVARDFNVQGTAKVLELAMACHRQGSLKRMDYVSTAYVAGTKKGIVDESTLERSQSFANNYERSKFEAEQLVRSFADRLPITIHRPSIVVGHSVSGYTPHFRVLYWPLKLLSKNLLPFFPTNKSAKLDIVPVDYVASAIHALAFDNEAIGQTTHITAGLGNEVSIRVLLQRAHEYLGIKRTPVISFTLYWLLKKALIKRLFSDEFWAAIEMASPYEFYLRGTGLQFDSEKTMYLLKKHNIHAPRFDDYCQAVLGFCKDSKWGRRVRQPEYQYYKFA